MAFNFPFANFLSLHGRLYGLFRGLISSGDAFLGGDGVHGILNSFTDTITAHAGGTQAAALALVSVVNRVTVVGTAADSVKLPPSTPGMSILIINDAAANALQVFGAGTDTIDGVATATGVALTAAKRAWFICATAGAWQSLTGVKST